MTRGSRSSRIVRVRPAPIRLLHLKKNRSSPHPLFIKFFDLDREREFHFWNVEGPREEAAIFDLVVYSAISKGALKHSRKES